MRGMTALAGRASALRQIPAVKLYSDGTFRSFWLGNFGNAAGIELRIMAQAWLILELGGSQVWVGAANGLRFLPFIAISLVAGVWVDRFGGRIMLLVERILLAGLAVITALLVITEVVELWHVVVLSVASASILAMGMPSMQTLVRQIVPVENLQAAQSLNALSFSFARAAGPVGGGFLIAAFGLGSPWLALIGMYALTVLVTLRLPGHTGESRESRPLLSEIKAGLSYVRGNPVLARVMLVAFSVILAGAILPIIPIYARDRFDVGETGFGFMMAAFALGQGTAAVYVAVTGGWNRKVPAVVGSGILWAFAMVLFGFSTYYPLSLFALFLAGIVVPVWASSIVTLLQMQSDKTMLGRVMSVYSLSLEGFTLAWLLGAWVGQLIGNDWMLLSSAVLLALVHGGLLVTSPHLRRL